MKPLLNRFRKAIGALLGGASGAAVLTILDAADLHVSPALATSIAVILATVGTTIAPRNQYTDQSKTK